jgi:hypothetical protein
MISRAFNNIVFLRRSQVRTSARSRPFHKFAVNIFKYDKVSNEEIRNGKKREGFIFGYPG